MGEGASRPPDKSKGVSLFPVLLDFVTGLTVKDLLIERLGWVALLVRLFRAARLSRAWVEDKCSITLAGKGRPGTEDEGIWGVSLGRAFGCGGWAGKAWPPAAAK